jgi:hypothetical protein
MKSIAAAREARSSLIVLAVRSPDAGSSAGLRHTLAQNRGLGPFEKAGGFSQRSGCRVAERHFLVRDHETLQIGKRREALEVRA